MNMSRYSLLAGLFLAPVLYFGPTPLQSQDAPADAPEKDWLEFYYENPTPEQFVTRMKDWSGDGTLDNEHARPALIAFISQVIRQNEPELQGWYENLSGLTPGQLQVMHTAMLFSRTAEADRIMREVFGKLYDEQKQETKKILEMPLDERSTMDMLWGFFYATGAESAIRRIVIAFRFKEAPDNPAGVEVPEGYVPMYKELPEFAGSALVANGERHPRVVEILSEMLEKDESLMKVEKEGVYDVLSVLDPKKYPPVDREKKAA
jgi:hypothetical protein